MKAFPENNPTESSTSQLLSGKFTKIVEKNCWGPFIQMF